MKSERRNPLVTLMTISAWIAGATLCGAAQGQTYDPVKDFSLKSNPNGVWSYGILSAVTGGTFTPFSIGKANPQFPLQLSWGTGADIPYGASDSVNTSGHSVKLSVTVVPPTDMVNLDGQDLISDLRFTAPATGVYSLVGIFQRTDIYANPVSVYIVENGTQTLFSADHLTGYGNQAPFEHLDPVHLTAGSTLDFVELGYQYNNDSTGLAARIVMLRGLAAEEAATDWLSRKTTGTSAGAQVATAYAPAIVDTRDGAVKSGGAPEAGTEALTSTSGTAGERYAVAISGALSTEADSGSNSKVHTIPISNAAILKGIVLGDATGTLDTGGLEIVFDALTFELAVINKATHQVVQTIGEQGANFTKVTEVDSSYKSGDNQTLCYTGYDLFFPGITGAAQSTTIVFHASKANAPAYNPASGFTISFVGGNDSSPEQFIQGFIRKK
jgi:hypothetical protein